MDAQMRESFLRELMILQSSPISLSANTNSSTLKLISDNTNKTKSLSGKYIEVNSSIESSSKVKSETASPALKTPELNIQEKSDNREVKVTLLTDSGTAGRTLSGLFISCDKNLTHILLNDLKTPIGIQSSALLRLNDVEHSSARFVQQVTANNIDKQASLAMLEKSFLPKKALVLRKFSRLEYERLCHPNLSEEQLASNLSQRGSVYETLIHYDKIQKSCLQQIESVLAINNIEYLTVDRFGYTDDKIDWADVIITSGGDGTFLMAASRVTTRDKPVIGVNSDPTKSVGHLCLPSKYSNNFDKVLDLLKKGRYQWQYKQRLRVTLIGEAADEDPRELNDIRFNLRGINQFLDQDECQDQQSPVTGPAIFQHNLYQQLPGPLNYRFPAVLPPNSTTTSMSHTNIAQMAPSEDNLATTHSEPKLEKTSTDEVLSFKHDRNSNESTHKKLVDSTNCSNSTQKTDDSQKDGPESQKSGFDQLRKSFRSVDGKVVYKIRQLKERALNEVFVGETLTARVSYYELSVDNNRLIKMKSSGLTVCTGTGSTSWYYNINKLTEQQVQSLVSIINKVTGSSSVRPDDTELIETVTKQFNETLTFSSTEPIMAYSIRDPVDYASAVSHSYRGNAKRIEVKSRMQNACLVLDGCQFYPFNDGSYALIEMYDEDALKTISIE